MDQYKLIHYIMDEFDRGRTEEAVRNRLYNMGCPSQSIEQALGKVYESDEYEKTLTDTRIRIKPRAIHSTPRPLAPAAEQTTSGPPASNFQDPYRSIQVESTDGQSKSVEISIENSEVLTQKKTQTAQTETLPLLETENDHETSLESQPPNEPPQFQGEPSLSSVPKLVQPQDPPKEPKAFDSSSIEIDEKTDVREQLKHCLLYTSDAADE